MNEKQGAHLWSSDTIFHDMKENGERMHMGGLIDDSKKEIQFLFFEGLISQNYVSHFQGTMPFLNLKKKNNKKGFLNRY